MKTTYEENENKDYMSGSKDHYHHLTFKEITQTIQTNMDLPSVFSTGKEPPTNGIFGMGKEWIVLRVKGAFVNLPRLLYWATA